MSEGLPDVCESPERDETSKKSAGPAPPLEAHRPSKVAPVSNPFQSKVSNPFASSVPTTQVKRKLESKPDSNKWNVNTVGSKVDQAKQSYFKTYSRNRSQANLHLFNLHLPSREYRRRK